MSPNASWPRRFSLEDMTRVVDPIVETLVKEMRRDKIGRAGVLGLMAVINARVLAAAVPPGQDVEVVTMMARQTNGQLAILRLPDSGREETFD